MINRDEILSVGEIVKDKKYPLWTIAVLLNRGGVVLKTNYSYTGVELAKAAHDYLTKKSNAWVAPSYRPAIYLMNVNPRVR